MSSFESILGIGEISQSGSSVSNDSFGRSGELVMGTHQTNGKSAWQLTLHDLDFTPTSARVTRFEIQGYNVPHCAGHPPLCTNAGVPDFRFPFSAPISGAISTSGHFFFDTSLHDNGILNMLTQQCGCGRKDVQSVRVTVQVAVLPTPVTTEDMRFEFCFECTVQPSKMDQDLV